MKVWVVIDEQLDRTLTERALTKDGGRHDVEAHRDREAICRDLASMQTWVEVPQRALTLHRFVDRSFAAVLVRDRAQQRGIAAMGHPSQDGQLAAQEQVDVGQFIRGHA